jgi:hypothetical protein
MVPLTQSGPPSSCCSTQTSVDQSFYGGGFYGAHGRQAMEDDELLFTEERSLLREGLGSRPTRDFGEPGLPQPLSLSLPLIACLFEMLNTPLI